MTTTISVYQLAEGRAAGRVIVNEHAATDLMILLILFFTPVVKFGWEAIYHTK